VRRRQSLVALAMLGAQGSRAAGSTATGLPPGAPVPAAARECPLGGARPQPGTDVADASCDPVRRGRPLRFSRDHGAHLANRMEWWYLTGWLGEAARPAYGMQLTFFRLRTGLAPGPGGRFAPRHLLLAHVALTDLAAGRHRHAQRVARWNADPTAAAAAAALDDTRVHIGDWSLRRTAGRLLAEVGLDDATRLQLTLNPTQDLVLQGDRGFSRKGPQESHASHYYSQPQLTLDARWRQPDGRSRPLSGQGWLDHEWSDDLMPGDAVGWDWLGINLFDGSALTVFRLRRADGSSLWGGGSWRSPDGRTRIFEPDEVAFVPGRRWTSPTSGAAYPVEWALQTAAGRFKLRALLDAQELDARASTGLLYWEGLSELLDPGGRRLGLGYLEMTGYAGRMALG
jgi:predicted secreted hydrolase